MAKIYVICQECTHTANIHAEDGCHAYGCTCKKPADLIGDKNGK